MRKGLLYLMGGLKIVARSPWLFAQIVVYFSLPALLAAFLSQISFDEAAWRMPLFFFLDSVTTVVGPVVFMMAVAASYHGAEVSLDQVVRRALPWLPRYLWTNVHTSLIFWIPVGSLLMLWGSSGMGFLAGGIPGDLWAGGRWLLLGCVAAYFHARTLLAPFLAVHSNLPGTRAAWESWRLSAQYTGPVISTFLVCSAPLAAPLLLVLLAVATGYSGPLARSDAFPHLVWVALQLVRLTLIPGAYLLYHDIAETEDVRWEQEVSLGTPLLVRMLLGITAWIPPLGPTGVQGGPAASYWPEVEEAAPVAVNTSRSSPA